MVEVFKTNVTDTDLADMLVDQIHKVFNNYKANFDLDDCDKVLRVECKSGFIECSFLIDLLKSFGFDAEILPDEVALSGINIFSSEKVS